VLIRMGALTRARSRFQDGAIGVECRSRFCVSRLARCTVRQRSLTQGRRVVFTREVIGGSPNRLVTGYTGGRLGPTGSARSQGAPNG
jgi:hypothetical protein